MHLVMQLSVSMWGIHQQLSSCDCNTLWMILCMANHLHPTAHIHVTILLSVKRSSASKISCICPMLSTSNCLPAIRNAVHLLAIHELFSNWNQLHLENFLRHQIIHIIFPNWKIMEAFPLVNFLNFFPEWLLIFYVSIWELL